jgi:CheY-like chemotaxis protein
VTDAIDGQNAIRPRILIADDDPAIVSLLVNKCTQMGFSVDTATNGLLLLLKARRSEPDVIITDVSMPELDGFSACSRLSTSGGKPIDIIVITASSNPEAAKRCEHLGMFYRPKGPDFWSSIEVALSLIFPEMICVSAKPNPWVKDPEVHERPRVLLIDDDRLASPQTWIACAVASKGERFVALIQLPPVR